MAARTAARAPSCSVLTTKQGVYDKSVEGKVPKDGARHRPASSVHVLQHRRPCAADVWWMDLEAPPAGTAPSLHRRAPLDGPPRDGVTPPARPAVTATSTATRSRSPVTAIATAVGAAPGHGAGDVRRSCQDQVVSRPPRPAPVPPPP